MISISVDSTLADRFFSQFPAELGRQVDDFKDRVGFKLEAESKREAPAITGNLRRHIIYRRGELSAHAEYSKYVHGKPFYTNKIRRKETPFITNAISNSESFIKDEARRMMQRMVE